MVHTHCQVSKSSDTSAAAPCPVIAAKYQSEISHNVSDVRSGKAGCLDFHKVAYAGHGLSVLLTGEVNGQCRTCAEEAQHHWCNAYQNWAYHMRVSMCLGMRMCVASKQANTGQSQALRRASQCSVTQTVSATVTQYESCSLQLHRKAALNPTSGTSMQRVKHLIPYM
jgi:hypothetical protein